MPWECCDATLNDTDDCPECGLDKASWTVKWEATRQFQVATKRVILKLTLVDADGQAVGDEPYEATLPNLETTRGQLDEHGYAKLVCAEQGVVEVSFPERNGTVSCTSDGLQASEAGRFGCEPRSRQYAFQLGRRCSLGKACPIQPTLDMRARYHEALRSLEDAYHLYGVRLAAAEFVQRRIGLHTASGADDEPFWEALRGPGGAGEAKGLGSSYLAEDIQAMQKAFADGDMHADVACQALVARLGDGAFQQHLLDEHTAPLGLDMLEQAYGPQLMSTAAPIRELDHVLAVATEELGQRKDGLAFLGELVDEQLLEAHVAFKDMWGHFKTAASSPGPVGKLMFNVMPVVQLEIQRAVAKGAAALGSPQVKKSLAFLGDVLGVPLAATLQGRAKTLSGHSFKLKTRLANKRFAKQVANLFDDLESDGALGKLRLVNTAAKRSAWLSIFLDTITFFVALEGYRDHWTARGFKDFVGVLGNVSNVTKSSLELLKANRSTAGKFLKAESAAKCVRGAAGIAGVFSMVLSTWDAVDAHGRHDEDARNWNVASAVASGVAVGGLVAASAPIVAAATVAGLVASVFAVLAEDTQFVAFLKRTPWGQGDDLPAEEVIPAYFKAMPPAPAAPAQPAPPRPDENLQKGNSDAKHLWGVQSWNQSGTFVADLQRDLLTLGYWLNRKGTLKRDGNFGPKTAAAVKTFQLEHPEVGAATGVVTPKTRAKLDALLEGVKGDDAWRRPALQGFFELPPASFSANTRRMGGKGDYSHYGTSYDESWGTRELLDCLEKTSRATDLGFIVGDLSKRGGGDIKDHTTHEHGTDADIDSPDLCSIDSPSFDKQKAWELAKAFLDNGAQAILFNCKYVIEQAKGRVFAVKAHHNHMHVQVTKRTKASDPLQECAHCLSYEACRAEGNARWPNPNLPQALPDLPLDAERTC